MSSSAKWAKAEAETFTSPEKAALSEDHDLEVFRARSIDFDFRRAEALCLVQPTDVLQAIRTRIARGLMQSARDAVAFAFAQNSALRDDSEWLLESARLNIFFHEWTEALSELGRLLQLSPSGTTRLTALQSRSIAAFEAGEFALALSDIEQIRSLARLYPQARPAFYAEILALKIAALLGEGKAVARKLPDFWERTFRDQRPSLDLLLTLLRLESHVLRSTNQDPASTLVACAQVARALGDDLYAALARFELWLGRASAAERDELPPELAIHPKIKLLHQEMLSSDLGSTSARLLRSALPSGDPAPVEFEDSAGVPIGALILPRRLMLVVLEPFKVLRIPQATRPFETLGFVAEHKTFTKADLFSRIFGGQKYVEHLHSATLHQILSRARKLSGVNLRVRDGLVTAEGLVWVKTT